MMEATDFEFRNRWWIFGAIFGGAFFSFAFDHVPFGARIAARLAAAGWPETRALHAVFGIAALLMIFAALVRIWGSAYLGREVVHDAALHGETLHAVGPYRHVRNPLYFGNMVMMFAMAFFAPVAGSILILIAMPIYTYRLIGREEAALAASQGENFRAFCRAVPRLWPSLRPRIPVGTSAPPDWINGLAAEAFFLSFALGVIGCAVFLQIYWLYAGFVASPLLSWLAGFAVRKPTSGAPAA